MTDFKQSYFQPVDYFTIPINLPSNTVPTPTDHGYPLDSPEVKVFRQWPDPPDLSEYSLSSDSVVSNFSPSTLTSPSYDLPTSQFMNYQGIGESTLNINSLIEEKPEASQGEILIEVSDGLISPTDQDFFLSSENVYFPFPSPEHYPSDVQTDEQLVKIESSLSTHSSPQLQKKSQLYLPLESEVQTAHTYHQSITRQNSLPILTQHLPIEHTMFRHNSFNPVNTIAINDDAISPTNTPLLSIQSPTTPVNQIEDYELLSQTNYTTPIAQLANLNFLTQPKKPVGRPKGSKTINSTPRRRSSSSSLKSVPPPKFPTTIVKSAKPFPPTIVKSKASTAPKQRRTTLPGPIPATVPTFIKKDENGTDWISFQYSRKRVKSTYCIRCDVESVDISQLSPKFISDNCIYPRAAVPPDQYKGNRQKYESECNCIGWCLAYLNPDLANRRGLIQRAVDSWRNTNSDPGIRSRRVRKLFKEDYLIKSD